MFKIKHSGPNATVAVPAAIVNVAGCAPASSAAVDPKQYEFPGPGTVGPGFAGEGKGAVGGRFCDPKSPGGGWDKTTVESVLPCEYP